MHVRTGNHEQIAADGGKSMEKRAGKAEPALFAILALVLPFFPLPL